MTASTVALAAFEAILLFAVVQVADLFRTQDGYITIPTTFLPGSWRFLRVLAFATLSMTYQHIPIYTLGKFLKGKTTVLGGTSSGSSGKSGVNKDSSKVTVPRGRNSDPKTATRFDTQKKVKLPSSAAVELCVYLYTHTARCFVERFPAVSLYMVCVRHRAKPSLTWQINRALNDCVRRIWEGDNEEQLPATWPDLQTEWNVRTSFKPARDPDDLTFASDVVTFYIAGDKQHLENFLAFLDTFFVDRKTYPDPTDVFPDALEVHLYQHSTAAPLSEDIATRMDIPTRLHPSSQTTPIPFYIAAPPYGGQHVIITFVFENDELDTTMTGNLYPLRGVFAAQNLRGEYYGPVGENGRQTLYCRYLPDVQTNTPSEVNTLLGILTTELHNQLMLARVTTRPLEDTPGEAVLGQLRELPNLYWDT